MALYERSVTKFPMVPFLKAHKVVATPSKKPTNTPIIINTSFSFPKSSPEFLTRKEQQTAVENVTKLYRLGLEDVKADTDYDEKMYRRDVDAQHEQEELDRQSREEQFKKDQMAEQAKDRYFKLGIEVAGIVLPLIFYATWMKRGFKFEETGTYTSTTFRGLFNRFRPTSVIITYFSYNSVVVCFCFLFVYHKYHSPFIRAVVIYAEKNDVIFVSTRFTTAAPYSKLAKRDWLSFSNDLMQKPKVLGGEK